MIWDILAQKLVDAELAEPGVSLFYEEMSADITQGVMFRTPLNGVRINQYIRGYYKPVLQVIVRHTDPVAGAAYANDVAECLTITTTERYPATADRGKVELKIFTPRELPIRFPRLDGGAIEWSINFLTAFGYTPL